MAKAKKSSVPRKAKSSLAVVRRETRSARKRRREEQEGMEGDAAEESPRKRRRGEGDVAEESFEVLSDDDLDLEETAGEPTESEFEAGPMAAGPSTPRQAAVETAKMCAGDKVRYT